MAPCSSGRFPSGCASSGFSCVIGIPSFRSPVRRPAGRRPAPAQALPVPGEPAFGSFRCQACPFGRFAGRVANGPPRQGLSQGLVCDLSKGLPRVIRIRHPDGGVRCPGRDIRIKIQTPRHSFLPVLPPLTVNALELHDTSVDEICGQSRAAVGRPASVPEDRLSEQRERPGDHLLGKVIKIFPREFLQYMRFAQGYPSLWHLIRICPVAKSCFSTGIAYRIRASSRA